MEINYEAIRKLLIQVKTKINQKINAIDLTEAQKAIILKADKIVTTGDGLSYLADNGQYINIDLENLSGIYQKSQDVIDLFKIVKIDEAWESKLAPSVSMSGGTSIVSENKIYVMANLITLCYDINANTWSTKANMLTSRIYATSNVYNGKIYCIGGLNTVAVASNECYDIATDTWSTKASLPTASYGLTSQIHGNMIYCLAGSAGITYAYNITTDTWTTLKVIPSSRYYLSSAIYRGKIYCLGGYGNNTKNECYDISTDTWESKSDITVGRWSAACSIYNDNIYMIGGTATSGTGTTNNSCYDISEDAWTDKMVLPSAMAQCYSSIYENKIYVFGPANNVYTIAYTDYELNIGEVAQSKVDILSINGDGTKVLADNGKYIEYNKESSYRAMTNEEITTLINELKTI